MERASRDIGMWLLVLGLIVFLGTHIVTMNRDLRAGLIARFGEGGYKTGYSAASLAGFALIVWGFGVYRGNGYVPVWAPPNWFAHIALVLNLPVFVLLFSSSPPGMTTGKIQATVRHPLLLAIKIWASAHLLVNGDLGSMLLFGSFLAWAVLARVSLKRRDKAEPLPAAEVHFSRRDGIALGAGLLVYALFVGWLHPLLIGVRVLP